MDREEYRARAALVLLTVFWGSTFVVVHAVVPVLSPFVLIALRFLVAGAVLTALRPAAVWPALRFLPAAVPLTVSLFAGFALQTSGLQTTTPARSAFITALSVVLVPVVEFLYTGKRVSRNVAAAVALALSGLVLLFRPIGLEWRSGDTLTAIAAACFAFYIVELGRLAQRASAVEVALSQCYAMVALAGVGAAFQPPRLAWEAGAAGAVLYLGIACTALTSILMAWGQARVIPAEAAIIYLLEPVFATTLSVAIGREPFRSGLLWGGALILAAMVLAARGPSRKRV